ncbi:hypothetical protein HZA85_04255 [Candidatus Uhrbacteria bacterium]|nr:hypothetical protein [Candidatus Uhrbacteria bacterium]
MILLSAWIGYDLPFEQIEQHPQVVSWRKNGIEKRIKRPEHHLTVGYFDSVDVEALTAQLKTLSQTVNLPLSRATLTFDGYGQMGSYTYLTPQSASAPSTSSGDKTVRAPSTPSFDGTVASSGDKDANSGNPLVTIRQQLLSSGLLKENKDFHVSIGGDDPFIDEKPKQSPLDPPLVLDGKLVLVGKSDNDFKRYFWDDAQEKFVDDAGIPVHTMVLFPKIQADTATAAYLLARFGTKKFPGIDKAQVIFWPALPEGETAENLLKKGTLTVDLGGMFDHHLVNKANGRRDATASSLVAEYLGLANQKAFQKILAWAKRDDLEGKGTISDDPLDRAFGLSGLMMNLNRAFSDNPMKVLDFILPLLHYHIVEEQKRAEELPKEWEDLQASGKGEVLKLKQGSADLKAAVVQSDNIALPGFLRAAKRMDLIVQRRSTGHTNIITRQERSIDLRPVIEALRLGEALKKHLELPVDHQKLQATGHMKEVPMWYYDDAANTIQNGGVSPGDVEPTAQSLDEVMATVKRTIPMGIIGSLKRKKASGQ